MKGLDNILRLHQWKLDERRRIVADLERLAQRLYGQIADLERELEAEQKIAASDQGVAGAYGNYAERVIRRRDRLTTSLSGVEQEMSKALDEVAAAFREFKKFDIIRERQRQRAELVEKRREQKEMDEAGLMGFRRKYSS